MMGFGISDNWSLPLYAFICFSPSARLEGRSTYTLAKLRRLAADTIIAYSDKPLRLAVRFGFAMSFLALLYGLTILYRGRVHDIPVTGWASLIVSLYFIGGVIIAILGIIGIYLGKTFDEVKRRPLYIVSKTTFTQKDDSAK